MLFKHDLHRKRNFFRTFAPSTTSGILPYNRNRANFQPSQYFPPRSDLLASFYCQITTHQQNQYNIWKALRTIKEGANWNHLGSKFSSCETAKTYSVVASNLQYTATVRLQSLRKLINIWPNGKKIFNNSRSELELIVFSGSEGKNGLPLCQCEPLALFSKLHSPAEGLAAQRPWEAAEGEAAQELAEEARGLQGARLWWKGPCVGRPCMLAQEQASSSHRPFRPFLWGIHTEFVKMASG
jgi:hypothetical protein